MSGMDQLLFSVLTVLGVGLIVGYFAALQRPAQ
jgi:hypothetical protein